MSAVVVALVYVGIGAATWPLLRIAAAKKVSPRRTGWARFDERPSHIVWQVLLWPLAWSDVFL